MRKSDMSPLVTMIDIPAAFGLLTRMPTRVNTAKATARGAASAWAFPLVGAFVGVVAAGTVAAMLWLGLPPSVAAIFAVLVPVLLTGAMHEDGLADTADGLWGGWTKERRLAIMKDSHIGTYGALAIGFTLLLRGVLLTTLISDGAYVAGLIMAAMISRASMVGILAYLPNARDTGLSQAYGKPSGLGVVLAGLLCLAAALALVPSSAIWIILAATGAAVVCGIIAKAKIGGQTGDIVGATQQVTEIVVLSTLLVG